jgi:hypothetical protein
MGDLTALCLESDLKTVKRQRKSCFRTQGKYASLLRMLDSGFAFIRGVVVIAAVIGSMALYRKLFPATTSNSSGNKLDIQELDERFMPLRWKVIGAMIAICILFAFGTWKALSGINSFLASIDGPAAFYLLPQTAIWWFFPGFGSVALCWELTLQIWAIFGTRDQVNLFSDWTNLSARFWGTAGMNSRKVLRWLALLIALPIGVFTALALNMHASVGPDTIRDCGYAFKPCAVYPVAGVLRMTQIEGFRTKDGKLTRRPGIVLDFKDGRRWSSADWGDFKNSVDPALSKFLTEKTNLTLETAITENDIPPLM